MPTPLPSPNGTNLERLYITRGPMALDAAPDMPEDVMRTLLAKFSDADKALLRSILDEDDGAPAGGASAQDRVRRAADASRALYMSPQERERISLMVNAFGERVSGSASTEARAAYEAAFPNATRLK